jgi:hypothetical protein
MELEAGDARQRRLFADIDTGLDRREPLEQRIVSGAVHQDGADLEAVEVDQALNDQAALSDEEILLAQPVVIADVAERLEARVVG